MTKKATVGLCALATLIVSAAMVIAAKPAAAAYSVSTLSNVCYQPSRATCVGGTSHQFDAYLPSNATQPSAGVILIHGGSFIGGDKSDMGSIGNKLASNGMAAFSINYQLDGPSVVGFPMEVNDAMTAISYIRAHARQYHVDPTRLASFGTSAGATLAVYSAMKAAQSDPAAQVSADVGWSGGYDFTVGTSGAIDQAQLQNVEYYLGCTDPTVPSCQATAAAASATTLVRGGDPPTLLANSTDYNAGCEIVNPAQAQEMAGDLTSVGVPVQLDLNNLCAHAMAYGGYEIPRTISFLKAHLFVAPVIRSTSSKTFRVGTTATFTVRSTANPTASLTVGGSLPIGITFTDLGNGTATLGGTPAPGTEGTYQLVITAANGGQPQAVQNFTLIVAAARP